jgi:hypothetical protein
MQTTKERAFSFRALVQKIRNWLHNEYLMWFTPTTNIPKTPTPLNSFYVWLRYFSVQAVKYRWWKFSESFKWQLKCYLNFWRMPTILRKTIDGFFASEVMRKELTTKEDIAESFMEEIEELVHVIYLKEFEKEYHQTTKLERGIIHQSIKEKYDDFELRCPDKYLTAKQKQQREDDAYDNYITSRGEPVDPTAYLPYQAKALLKKHNLKSRHFADWELYDKEL